MDRFFVYSLVPVVAVALLLFFSATLYGRRARGLAIYCLAVAGWSGGIMLAAFPSTAPMGQRLVAGGGFVVAGFLHAAHDLLGERRRAWVWASYAVASLILLVQIFHPGLIHDPVLSLAGPWFWPSMLAAFAAATLPLARLVRAARLSSGSHRARLVELAVAGALGYGGASAYAVLSSFGRPQPIGMLVVLASLFVLADVVRRGQDPSGRRLLDRSMGYAALAALLWSGFLFGVLSLLEPGRHAYVTEYRISAWFLLGMAALAFEPLRRHVVELVGARLLHRVRASDLAGELVVQESRADQAARLAELGALTSAVAHEVRGPLGVLSAQLRVVERSGADAETLASMREQISRAERFVADMLRYGRPRPLELRSVDMAPLVELAMSTARTSLGDPSDAVQFVLDATAGIQAEADHAQLSQVFVVLFDNALLALAGRDNPQIHASVRTADGKVLVRVDDNGPGIAEELLPRLFDPFVTGRSGDGRRQGTGLGLAIARRIVERHRGVIRAGRADLGGARFDLEIPVQQPLMPVQGEGA